MSDWSWQIDGWIIMAGLMAALPCALLGNFLLLRRMSMMGDAISHAVLLGLVVGFMVPTLFGFPPTRAAFPMLLGAAIAGIATALLTQWIHSLGRVEQSASMGVAFTLLFAIGLILIRRYAHHVDLDPGCVLYGMMESIPAYAYHGYAVPPPVTTLAIVFAIDLAFVLLFYKELKISSFDPDLATTLGINANLMHYLLMTLTAVTTVAAFEAVGSILVIAMLIVPAAAAHLLTDRLPSMIVVSLVIAAICAFGGHYTAVEGPGWFGYEGVSTLTSAMMAVVAGMIFTVVMLLAPRQGIVSKLAHRASLSLRIIQEDIIGLLYRLEELGRNEVTRDRGLLRRAIDVGPLTHWLAVRRLERMGQVVRRNGGYTLTQSGRDAARQVVRSHRLWEAYLAHELSLPADHLHGTAARLEHLKDADVRRGLNEATGTTERDPHGREVPREGKDV